LANDARQHPNSNKSESEPEFYAKAHRRPPTSIYGIRRFVTAAERVAAPRSKAAPEMFRAMTRTVLFDHVKASSLMKRV
jgi:hypothetical protein